MSFDSNHWLSPVDCTVFAEGKVLVDTCLLVSLWIKSDNNTNSGSMRAYGELVDDDAMGQPNEISVMRLAV
jgi:hypothetical protein